MIAISYVEMLGFRGFRNSTRFEFPKGFAVLTGRNGAGKSTVFDAIDFAFTGSINKYPVREAKGGGLEEYLWWVGSGETNGHYVAIGLKDDDGRVWEIRRIRDGSLVGEDLAKVSNELCQHSEQMPDWRHALIQTALIRDELIAATSLDMTEQARFTAVRAALGTSDTSAYLARFRKIVTAAESAKLDQENRHTKSVEALGRLLTSLTETRSLAKRQEQLARAEDTFATELGEAWRAAPKKVEAARGVVAERRQALNAMRVAVADAERFRTEYKETTSSEFSGRLDSLRQEAAKLESQIAEIAAEKAAANQALVRAQNEDDQATTYLALLDSGSVLACRVARVLCAPLGLPLTDSSLPSTLQELCWRREARRRGRRW
jgi:DNA repair exonuclease SbcCD ATPase subunit